MREAVSDAALPADDAELYPVVYDQLKRIARHQRRVVGSPDTLSTTELVHEAFLKLARDTRPEWQDRAHFFGTASRAMRQVLVDFARKRRTTKRGGDWGRVSLGSVQGELEIELDEILALDAALLRLDAVDQDLRRIVELRFFAGLPVSDTAEILGVTTRTIERNWLKARLFLLHELDPPHD